MTATVLDFPVLDDYGDPALATFKVPGAPGVALKLRRDVAPLLLEYASWYHRNIEPLVPGTCWGFAPRKVRGSATIPSRHAPGIAEDLNAPQHPLGKRGTFTADERQRMKAKADSLGLRLGEFYVRRVDGMHAEINVPHTTALELVRRLQSTPAVRANSHGQPTISFGDVGHPAAVNEAKGMLRAWRRNRGWSLGPLDGRFDTWLREAVRTFQRTYDLDVDGVLGPQTWAKLLAVTKGAKA